jgi:hypothetical protein
MWRRADDLVDSAAAEGRRHELTTIIKALGWEPGIEIP